MTRPIRLGAVAALREQLRGRLVSPDDTRYDAARKPDAAIEILVEGFRTTPSPLSAVIVEHSHGAIARVAPDATSFGLRSHPYHLEILGCWDQAEKDAAISRGSSAFSPTCSRLIPARSTSTH